MLDESQLLALAQKIDPVAAKDYAKSKGWEILPTRKPAFFLKHPNYSLRQILIPLEPDSSDFAEAMLDAANRLGDLECRPLGQVIEDLLEPNADVLRQRMISNATERGIIPLEESIALLEGARKALLSSACTVIEPRQHHPRLSKLQAVQFVNSCRLGQTEVGSFVIKMICPLSVDGDQIPMALNEEPFARKVTNQILSSAKDLVQAIDQDQVPQLLERNELEKTLSSNFCQALLQMHSCVDGAKLELSAKWAPMRPAASSTNHVILGARHFGQIEQIYSALRNSREEDPHAVLIGTVEELKGEVGADGRRHGLVLLRVMADDELVNASIDLSADDYDKAVGAHVNGPSVRIKVRGKLQRFARASKIVEASDFEIIA